ncbi:MAG: hypothetical protein AAF489_15295 [Bacteroidota bacterium]
MKMYINILAFLLLVSNSYGQKDMTAVPVEESNLKIEAEATSISKVKFILTPTITYDAKTVGIKLPIEFEVNPFNEFDFEAKLREQLLAVYDYQRATVYVDSLFKTSIVDSSKIDFFYLTTIVNAHFTEKEKVEHFGLAGPTQEDIKNTFLKKPVGKDANEKKNNKEEIEKNIASIKKIILKHLPFRIELLKKDFYLDLKNYASYNKIGDEKEDSATVKEYYESKQVLDERVKGLYRYFNGQLTLLFRFDTEPVAGRLFYNTQISKIQYYENRLSERSLDKRVSNYHRLIKQLNDLRYNDKARIQFIKALTKFDKDTITKDRDAILNKIKFASKKRDSIQAIIAKQTAPTSVEINKKKVKKYDSIIKKLNSIRKTFGPAPVTVEPFNETFIKNHLIDTNEVRKEAQKEVKTKLAMLNDYLKYRDHLINDSIAQEIQKTFTLDYFKTLTRDYYKSLQIQGSETNKETSGKLLKLDTLLYQVNKLDSVSSVEKLIDKNYDIRVENAIVKIQNKYSKKDTEKAMVLKVVEHFKGNTGRKSKTSKEYKEKYLQNPESFLIYFEELISQFRNYRYQKRKKLVKDKLTQLKNKEVYDSLLLDVQEYKKIQELISKNQFQVEFIEKHKKYMDAERELFDETGKVFFNWKESDKDDRPADSSTSNGTPEFRHAIANGTTKLEKFEHLKTKIDTFKTSIKELEDYIHLYITDDMQISNSFYKCFATKYNSKNLPEIDGNLTKKEIGDFRNALIECWRSSPKDDELKKTLNKTALKARLDSLRNSTYKKLKKNPLWDFEATDIQLDINDGFIEGIVVYGEITGISDNPEMPRDFNKKLREMINDSLGLNEFIGRKLKFNNIYPYGFSTSKDYDVFKELRIFVYHGIQKQYEMKLESLFPNYVQTLQNDRLDFSPRDQKVSLPEPGKKKGSIDLKKDQSSKLFNIDVYSDFNGLKAADPNGVIQFELKRNIPLYTKKNVIKRTRFNWGLANYVEPKFRWSRLNTSDDEKSLTLSYLTDVTGAQDSIPYVTQLDLIRYENIQVGASLNIGTFDLPLAKLRLELNLGGFYGRTKVLDTRGEKVLDEKNESNVKRTFDLNTWRYYPEFKVRLRPEERYGLDVGLRAIHFNTVTNDFSNISSEDMFTRTLTDNPQWLHQIEINAHFSPSATKDDLFFFRYRYTNNSTWEYNGFSEIQVGYSMQLKI